MGVNEKTAVEMEKRMRPEGGLWRRTKSNKTNTANIFVLAFFSLLFFFWAAPARAQTKSIAPNPESAFQRAQALYNRATAYGLSAQANAQTEAHLNQAALQAFASLEQTLSGTTGFDSLRFFVPFRLGLLHQFFERNDTALLYYRQAIAAHKRSGLADSFLFQPLLYAGILLYYQNQLEAAAAYFNRAERLQAAYTKPLEESERLYNTLGVIQYETGNYLQASNYFVKAEEALPRNSPYYHDLLVNYRINQAQMYLKLEAYDQALRLYESLLGEGRSQNEIYHNIGLVYLGLGRGREALQSFARVQFGPQKQVQLLANQAQACLLLQRYDEAGAFLQKALAVWTRHRADFLGYGRALKVYGDWALATGQHEAALQWYTQAIAQFYPAYQNKNVDQNPQQFSGVFSYIHLFGALKSKGEAADALFQKTGKQRWGLLALDAYRSAFALMAYVQRTYSSDEARLFLNRYKYTAHNAPIDLAFRLYRQTGKPEFLEALYRFDQQNKASVLALNQQPSAQNFAQPQLAARVQKIRTHLTRLSLQNLTDTAKQKQVAQQMRDYELQLEALQKEAGPNTAPLDNIPALSVLQDQILEPGTALVSYHLSPQKLTVLLVTKNKVAAWQKPLHPQWVQAVAQMKNPVGVAPAKDLGRWLLEDLPLQNFRRLIIIPDDELHYLSFESLLTTKGQLLLRAATVQYQYTTALLQKENRPPAPQSVLALAPFAQGSVGAFAALPFSAQEVAQTGGTVLVNKQATKAAFLQYLKAKQVLHLATHAVAGEGRGASYVVLAADKDGGGIEKLYAEEIEQLPLSHVRLVVLSACETGSGGLVRGEGIMSLSRAFAYAGCPNVIASLWKADDEATAYLMGKTYGYLQKGKAVAVALQQAKQDYLDDPNIHPRRKHPYYWSHLVFVGHYQETKSFAWWWLAVGGLVLLGAWTVLRFKF